MPYKQFIVFALFISLIAISCNAKITVNGQSPTKAPSVTISEERLGQIYSEGISSGCYEYSFDQSKKKTTFLKQTFGEYKGGIKGLLLYCNFPDAVEKFLVNDKNKSTSEWDKGFHDIKKFEALAGGIKAFTNDLDNFEAHGLKKDGKQEFHHYNPAIVKWGHYNLIPKPESMIGPLKAQQLYDRVFRRFFRVMTESYYSLDRKGFSAESANYKKAYLSGTNMVKYLKTKYRGEFPEYDKIDSNSQMETSYAYGFWLRRKIDGSSKEMWIGFKKIMNAYDKVWFNTRMGL